MERIRAFIAIELPDELKDALGKLQAQIRETGLSGIKWVDPYAIHITLKFLGYTDTSKINEIAGIMASAAAQAQPFSLKVTEPGAFPSLRRPQVVWVGLGGDLDRLAQLQRDIESGLKPLGFEPESRPFSPHLTLARMRDNVSLAERQNLAALLTSTKFNLDYEFSVEAVTLMRSQLTPRGPIYSRLNQAQLGYCQPD